MNSSPFDLIAISTNPAGYSWTFCVHCGVLPTGANSEIPFTSNTITVTQTPLDCSTVLTPKATFTPSVTFAYQQTPSTVTTGYLDVFDHQSVTDCPVTNCFLKLYVTSGGSGICDFSQDFPGPSDVTLEATTPFAISTLTTTPIGYTHMFCLQCEITPTATGVAIPVGEAGPITVTQNPLDCSLFLSSNTLATPTTISYQAGGLSVSIANDYTDFFTEVPGTPPL